MGDVDYIKELSIDTSILEGKKDQTTKKIAYVRSYVEKWLLVTLAYTKMADWGQLPK